MNSLLKGGKRWDGTNIRYYYNESVFASVTLTNAHSSFYLQVSSSNATIGQQVITKRGLNYTETFYWISIGALLGFWIILNAGFTCALGFSKSKLLNHIHMVKPKVHI